MDYNRPLFWSFNPQRTGFTCSVPCFCWTGVSAVPTYTHLLNTLQQGTMPVTWRNLGTTTAIKHLTCCLTFLKGKQYPCRLDFVGFRPIGQVPGILDGIFIGDDRKDGRPRRKSDGDHPRWWPLGVQAFWWRTHTTDYSKGRFTFYW